MSHVAYSPVGYDYRAEHYCLDCIPEMIGGHPRSLSAGFRAKECNCCECRLDRIATDRGIDRYNERSFDMDTFPKSIPYHNDLHVECGPQSYGYGPGDPEWELQYCDATCSNCHVVIDGTDHWDGHSWESVCPAFKNRMEFA